MDRKIFFLIPTYNESQNIELLAQNLNAALPSENVHFVFVDDCSTDNTVDLLKKYFTAEKTRVIEKDLNVGPGHSFNTGFEWILENSSSDSDLIITMEADNTSDISILNTMTTISMLGFDLVLASVYAQGGGFSKTSFFRKVISFFANILFRSIYNIKTLTLSSFYRIYSVHLIRRIKNKYPILISENGFICMLEILLKSIRVNASIIEVPMTLKSDFRKGKSKMKIIKTSFSYLKFLVKNIKSFKH